MIQQTLRNELSDIQSKNLMQTRYFVRIARSHGTITSAVKTTPENRFRREFFAVAGKIARKAPKSSPATNPVKWASTFVPGDKPSSAKSMVPPARPLRRYLNR